MINDEGDPLSGLLVPASLSWGRAPPAPVACLLSRLELPVLMSLPLRSPLLLLASQPACPRDGCRGE